jgi:hypothetical protein
MSTLHADTDSVVSHLERQISAQTVENMYHVSTLLRDANAGAKAPLKPDKEWYMFAQLPERASSGEG